MERAKRGASSSLTSDVEAQFDFDFAVRVHDSVAALVRARDAFEGDVAPADTDSTLVALPGQVCAGEQHQTGPVGGKEQSHLLRFRVSGDTRHYRRLPLDK